MPSNLTQRSLVVLTFLSGTLLTWIYFGRLEIVLSPKPSSCICDKPPITEALSVYRSVFDGCGTWQESYIERHRAILNGSLPPRYLVSVAVEAGIADRLTGILTEFVFALLTNRAFQIISYGTLPQFEAALLSPNINWSRAVDNDTLIDNLKFTYRGQRGYDGDRSYGPEVDTKLYWPLYWINRDGELTFFVTSNVSKHPIGHENVTTLFIASNRGRLVGLFDNPYHRSQLFRMGLRPETAAKCFFNFLFAPTGAVRAAMFREFSLLQSMDVLKISIKIRVGDAVFNPKYDENTTTLAPYEPFFHCAEQIESFARLPGQRVIWYVTSESLRLRQLVKERYGEKILTDEKQHYAHGDCGNPDVKRNETCTKESQDSNIQIAFGQIYGMTMCDYHVISLISGFGRFGAFLSHYWHNVYQVHTENRSCGIGDFDSLESVSRNGAGL